MAQMKIAFCASTTALAQSALQELQARYGNASLAEADYVVAIGGDGITLRTIYNVIPLGKPVYAVRRTDAVGFMCNSYKIDDLPQKLIAAHQITLHPLRVDSVCTGGQTKTALAINEVVVIRHSSQSAKLRVQIDGKERLNCFSGDGLLVATPVGSTAYNHSAGGPIMPIDANSLVMTAICGFRPRRWSYAVLPQDSVVNIEVLEIEKRPVRIESGPQSIPDIQSAQIWLDRENKFTLMFDPDQHLSERIVREQFMH